MPTSDNVRMLLVTYDLLAADECDGYKGLFEELKQSPSWSHYINATWLVVTTESPSELWKRIKPHLHEDDNVLIIEVAPNYQGWLPKRTWEWMNKRFAELGQ